MRIIVIYGPTAGGKSSLALEMAVEHDGVVINADSMQVYDALHVLTAQPPADEQAQAPHKLYACLAPHERCSAAQWREMAIKEIENADTANKTPIIVGGTGFYMKSLMEGLSPIPDVPLETRAKITAIQEEDGNPAFHARLAKIDPVMAERLNPNDTQRLIRAYEVLEETGKSLSYWQDLPPEGPPDHWEFEKHFINPEREILYERCNKRFEQMLDMGIMDEINALNEKIVQGTVPPEAPITHALGYHPLSVHMRGKCSLDDAIEQSKQETRNYAKRQITWFRNQL